MLPIECTIGRSVNHVTIANNNSHVNTLNEYFVMMIPSMILIQYRHAVIKPFHFRPHFFPPGNFNLKLRVIHLLPKDDLIIPARASTEGVESDAIPRCRPINIMGIPTQRVPLIPVRKLK